ncbi:MAG: PBP1A family penicillin-binding protein [bacterium]
MYKVNNYISNPNSNTGKKQPLNGRQKWYIFCRVITIAIFVGFAFFVGTVAGIFIYVSQNLPDVGELSDIRPSIPSRILASDGTLLAKISLAEQNRQLISLKDMGKVVDAIQATEDERFYSHPGIDPWGIARAIVKNVTHSRAKEGASTITQQLVRNMYNLNRGKDVRRKLQEMVMALELERKYTKQEILETYLNMVFFGTNKYGLQCYGVQMAARSYFNKDAKDLSLEEAALIAGLPKSPIDYNPYRNAKKAKSRRNIVLDAMFINGKIDKAAWKAAKNKPVKLAEERKPSAFRNDHAPYFVQYVQNDELSSPDVLGEDAENYLNYGIDIYTSLDPRMQKIAEDAVVDGVNNNRSRNLSDGALISIDPITGYVKAMVGGIDFKKDQFNIVTKGKRQPGSSFKPFDYTSALLSGYTPKTKVEDRPQSFPMGNGKMWRPQNSDGRYQGRIPMERALWGSRNCAAVFMANDIGIDNIISVANRMGIKSKIESNLSTALGSSVVTPLEICSAYCTLANNGIKTNPSCISRICYSGSDEVIYERRIKPERVLPMIVANTMKEMMRGVVERGTGRAAQCPFKVSGKTGTTNSYKDAWFIGYTDDLVTAVWVGNRDNTPMNRTFGGTVPAPIWKKYMLSAQPIMAVEHIDNMSELAIYQQLDDSTFSLATSPYILKVRGKDVGEVGSAQNDKLTTNTPGEKKVRISICTESGNLSTRWCPERRVTLMLASEAPTTYCMDHSSSDAIPAADDNSTDGGAVVSICVQSGKIANRKCPVVQQRRFLHPPTARCNIH